MHCKYIITGSETATLTLSCDSGLTPTDERNDDNELFGDQREHEDKVPEHEHSLAGHPQHGDQGEVVQDHRDRDTELLVLCAIDADDEDHHHEGQGDAELHTEFGAVFLAEFPAGRKEGMME